MVLACHRGWTAHPVLWIIPCREKTDLKAILAYSTISQLGLIMSLLGVGSAAIYFGYGESSAMYTVAITAALLHLFNHATFKAALFMVVGVVDHETGTRDIRKLGGLASFMPVTFTVALVGALAMAGIPPFNGFLSKELFFQAMVEVTHLSIFGLGSWVCSYLCSPGSQVCSL